MLVKRDVPNYCIDYDMCRKCNGVCCKANPCQYFPSDFEKPDVYTIGNLIQEGLATIDIGYIQRDIHNKLYFLRAPAIHDQKVKLDGNRFFYRAIYGGYSGGCIFYELPQRCFFGISYDIYDEERIECLSDTELFKLFEFKKKRALEFGIQNFNSLEEEIALYLEYRQKYGAGGCSLNEDQRPGGGIYAIPDYDVITGKRNCKIPDTHLENNWQVSDNQKTLKLVLREFNSIDMQ